MARVRRRASCLALVLGVWSGTASAACTVTGTGVAFGVYSPVDPLPRDVSGSVTVTCTLDGGFFHNYNFTAVFSTGNSGSYASRYMLRFGGTERLYYNAFNAGYTQVFGNGSAGTVTITGSIFVWLFDNSNAVTTPVAGRIPQTQNAVPGSYSDTLMVTLTF